MKTTNTKRYLTPAASSRLLKKELRATFPGVKFSVRLSRGTGYGNAFVTWTDGPTAEAVEAVIDRFEGESFDGMTDSVYRHDTAVEVDGEVFQSGLGIINSSRRVSAAAQVAAEATLRDAGFVYYESYELAQAARSLASKRLDVETLVARSRSRLCR